MIIEKINYRDQVRLQLLKNMRQGNLQPGDSLSLANLSRELDVSVTPIREALTQLEQSKIVVSIPNRGFIIPELIKAEAINLYELVFTIESLAIEKSEYSERDINKLKKQQVKFKKSSKGLDRINFDMEFHELLTIKYNNPLALQMLSELKTRIFFYEKSFMESGQFLSDSDNHHVMIIKHLENQSKEKAIQVLKTNWLQILKYI